MATARRDDHLRIIDVRPERGDVTDPDHDRERPAAPLHRMTIAYIIGTYPSLTTTFIDREISELRRRRIRVDICSLRRPTGRLSTDQEQLAEDVRYLLPVSLWSLLVSHVHMLATRPVTFLRTLGHLLRQPHGSSRRRLKTVLHFGEGVHAAYGLRSGGYQHLHAHFVDRAAVVALVAGRLLRIPYSATAHANDIYVDPVLLPTKIAQARFVATCTRANAAHLGSLVPSGSRSRIIPVYHGLDLPRYQPESRPDTDAPPLILAVGQLKEKKGLAFLVEACAALRERGYEFTCEIVGEGPLRSSLEELIDHRSLRGIVTLSGALGHDEVIERYRQASAFALPCVTSPDGDRDGIPNVVLEAMAMRLPVVSTRHSGLPEVVIDGWNGLLVPPQNVGALADALSRLLDERTIRESMGRHGREFVAARFDVANNVTALIEGFEEAVA
jgi:glycosyltransferase involved in cell wall biosynthesis